METLRRRELSEHPFDLVAQIRRQQRLDRRVHRPRLDLCQIEDLVDQPEQLRAGGVDGGGELQLLRAEIAVRVLGQHLGQDEQAVERRPQLVRHVREKLGLVLRSQRQLLRLLFDRRARQLDLAVLVLDFTILLREQLRLLFQLLVGLLQFLLLLFQLLVRLLQLVLLLPEPLLRCLKRSRLLLEADVGLAQLPLTRSEFIGERLRLLQQFFCPRHRGDRIEDDADALGELIQERQLDLREAVERGELDHCFDVVLE